MASARARWSQASESGSGRHALVWESGVFIALLSGDLPTVNARARRAELDLPRQLSPPWLALFSAMADAEQGRVAQARSSIDRIAREYEGDDLDLFSQYRRWAEGLVAWAEDRLTTAVAVLQRAVDRCSTTGAFALAGLILIDLAEVAATAGDPSRAARAAASAEDLAQRIGAPSFQAFHHFATAWSLLAMGRPDDAGIGSTTRRRRPPSRRVPDAGSPSPRGVRPGGPQQPRRCRRRAGRSHRHVRMQRRSSARRARPGACCPRSARARTASPRCWASRR